MTSLLSKTFSRAVLLWLPSKNTVAADQHLRLKKQWRDLYHRHQEFRAIILGYSPRDVIFGNKGLVKGDNPSDFTLPNMTFMEQELVNLWTSIVYWSTSWQTSFIIFFKYLLQLLKGTAKAKTTLLMQLWNCHYTLLQTFVCYLLVFIT